MWYGPTVPSTPMLFSFDKRHLAVMVESDRVFRPYEYYATLGAAELGFPLAQHAPGQRHVYYI